MDGTSIYKAWVSMKARCYNKKDKDYKNYGGRGIIVSKRWINNFPKFYSDMGDKPSLKHSLDRINVNGNYTKNNCRWATAIEQNNNRNNNHNINFNGQNMTLSDWCRKIDVPVNTMINRFIRGWSIERALTTKSDKRYNGNKYRNTTKK